MLAVTGTLGRRAHRICSLNPQPKVPLKVLNKLPDSDRVVGDGHLYELENFDQKTAPGQTLKFIEKVPVVDEANNPAGLKTVMDGTTNEDVLKVLIHRLGVLGAKFPCRENSLAVTKLEEALMWLNQRTANRVARGVEGKHVA